MKLFINLTQHNASAEQINEGTWIDNGESSQEIKNLITFEDIPNMSIISYRATLLTEKAFIALIKADPNHMCEWTAMIGGAPYLMGPLENALKKWGITPVYSFSKRVSTEFTNPNGEVIKTNTFKHIGFIEV